MIKHKTTLTAGLLIIALSLMTGVSYAWFSVRADTERTDLKAGYLEIALTGNAGEEVTLYPENGLHTTRYTVTNKSEITVFAKFEPGELNMYLLPDEYMDDGYVKKEFREALRGMTDMEKKEVFTQTNVINTDEIYFGSGDGENGGWTLTEGCEYLGGGKNGETYFLLTAGGSAECSFTVGLTPMADNKYQYSLFTLGEASAYATQNNETAIKILKGDD